MLTLPSSVRIYIAAEPVDLRRRFDGLAAAARSLLGDPLSGHLFCFLNKRKNRIKVRAAAWGPSALRQIRESAQALLGEGKVEEAFEFFLSALEAVLRKTRELELLVAKLRREGVGKGTVHYYNMQLIQDLRSLCRLGRQEDTTSSIYPQAEARENAALEQAIREAERARRPGGVDGRARAAASGPHPSRASVTTTRCRNRSGGAGKAAWPRSGSARM
jgi:hypothetical protein